MKDAKIQLKVTGRRTDDAGTDTKIRMIDNHRGAAHDGFKCDEVPPIVTADALFDKYKTTKAEKKREWEKTEEERLSNERKLRLAALFEQMAKSLRTPSSLVEDSILMDRLRIIVDKNLASGVGDFAHRFHIDPYLHDPLPFIHTSPLSLELYSPRLMLSDIFSSSYGTRISELLAFSSFNEFKGEDFFTKGTALKKLMEFPFEKLDEQPVAEPVVDPVYEQQHRERNRIKHATNRPANDLDDAWEKCQTEIREKENKEEIKPSLFEEDVLGDFDSWMDRRPEDIRYLMIADTDHINKDLRKWISTGKYLPALKKAGFDDLVLEYGPVLNAPVHSYLKGDISAHEFKEQLSSIDSVRSVRRQEIYNIALAAKKAGVMLHMFDEQTMAKDVVHMLDRKKYDEVLVDKIKTTFGDKKVAVCYGMAHLTRKDWMADLLGMEKCAVIGIHANLLDYRKKPPYNSEFPTEFTYLIEEDKVVFTRATYDREIPSFRDSIRRKLKTEEQRREFETFRENVRKDIESEGRTFVTADEIIRSVKPYWRPKNEGNKPSGP